MSRTSLRLLVLPCMLLGMGCPIRFTGGQENAITEAGVVAGTMAVDFKTRTDPAARYDTYTFKLGVAKTTEYVGKIRRHNTGDFDFSVDVAVRPPRNLDERKVVGKFAGMVPVDAAAGIYDIGGGGLRASPLRFSLQTIGAQPAFTDTFAGTLVDRSRKKEGLAAEVYTRLMGGKMLLFKVDKVDPLRLKEVELAKGPFPNYPHAVVDGRLDYVPATRDWLTNGVTFKYINKDGDKEVADVMTGSLKWNADAERPVSGKGYYAVNLRFNEAKHMPVAFDLLTPEEAYFMVDDSIPCLTGMISYEDQFIAGTDTPFQCEITFDLNANKLTKTQVTNFAKLWLLATVPIHD